MYKTEVIIKTNGKVNGGRYCAFTRHQGLANTFKYKNSEKKCIKSSLKRRKKLKCKINNQKYEYM